MAGCLFQLALWMLHFSIIPYEHTQYDKQDQQKYDKQDQQEKTAFNERNPP
jgi:hypothetical protein